MENAVESQGKSFKEVWMITIGHGLTHWYPATFYLLLPIIGSELGLSYSEIGFIITFQYIVSSISNIPGGMLVDTVGKKAFLMATSLFWVGFPYLLMSFTKSYWMVLLCVALVGIGNNLWHPTAIPTLAQRFSERKGFVLSVHGMGANVGDAFAPLAIGSLLSILSWREVVVINVIPGIIMAVIILIFLRKLYVSSKRKNTAVQSEENEGLKVKEYFNGIKQLFSNRSLVIISTSSAFRSMTQNALLTFLPLYLANELGYEFFWVGVGMFLLQAGGFVASPIAGYMSDKLGRKNILMSTMLMTAVVLLFMIFAGGSPLFIFFIAVLGFFLYAVRPVMQAWLMETTPKKMAGTSVGILFGMQSLGSSIAPLIGGIIADSYGLLSTFYFLAVTILLANCLVFFMPKELTGDQKSAAM